MEPELTLENYPYLKLQRIAKLTCSIIWQTLVQHRCTAQNRFEPSSYFFAIFSADVLFEFV